MRVLPILLALRRNAASQEGVALMEAVMSAAVLILVVLGVLAAMDAVTGTAGANKARTVAATLAERDQERLRGMRTLDIDQMNLEPYTVDVAGVTYTIESKAQWVNDASGQEVSCGLEAGQANYMRITSTVTSPITGAAVKPVVLTSLVAPQVGAASKGTATVLVKNAAGLPVQNLIVTATPTGRQERTNAAGCAVFGQLDAGSYDMSLNQANWVDKDGNTNPKKNVTVTAGNLSTVEFAYDEATSLDVVVRRNATDGDPSLSVVAANDGMTGKLRKFPSIDPVSSNPPVGGYTFHLRNLFPFVNGYTVYSGACLWNDPSKWVPTYFSTYPGKVTLAPGVPGGTITVYEPPTNLWVTTSSGSSSFAGAWVWAYPKMEGCAGANTKIFLGTTNSQGRLAYPGLPYGEYDICAAASQTSTRRDIEFIRHDNPAGDATQTKLIIPSSGTGSSCP